MSNARIKRVRVDRDAVEQAAAELVNRSGLASLSMSDLAAALDVKAPSLYAHVTGMDEVKRMLALRGLADLENVLARSALGKTTGDAVRAMLFTYLEFVRSNPGVYEAMIPPPPPGDAIWQEAFAKLHATTMTILDGYGFTPEETIHLQRGLRSLSHGFAAFEASGAFTTTVDRDESFGWLVDVFLAGLQPKITSRGTGAATRAAGTSARAAGRKAARA